MSNNTLPTLPRCTNEQAYVHRKPISAFSGKEAIYVVSKRCRIDLTKSWQCETYAHRVVERAEAEAIAKRLAGIVDVPAAFIAETPKKTKKAKEAETETVTTNPDENNGEA